MYRLYLPEAPLCYYVDCLWYANDRIPYRRERILPTGTIEIMLNFGAPFRVYDHHDASTFILNKDAWIAGLQTEYILNEPVAETHMMGIRVKPYALSLFLQPPAQDFHNQLVDMDLIWGNWIHELREQLFELPHVEQKFRHLEAVLTQRLLQRSHSLDCICYAVDMITHSKGAISVRQLSDDIGMSHKHLIHQFKQLVGVSPKAFSKVMRFQHVLMSIDPSQTIDWTMIAIQSDYYDQSHFNKDFIAFTGMSPTQYMAYRRQFYGDALEQGDGVHFVPVA